MAAVEDPISSTLGSQCFQFTGRPLNDRRHLVRLAVVAVAGGIIAWGAARRPAEPTKPMLLEGRAQVSEISGRRFRVACFNIRRGKGNDGVRDLLRTADAIRSAKPDVVGLFEVDGDLWGPQRNQAAELAGELGMAAVFAPTERRFWHDHFGNGLLSRVELRGVHRIPLTCTQRRKYRNALLTRFTVGGRTVNFLAAHLDRVQDRERQLRDVFALFHALQPPAVLVGDLNTMNDDPLLRKLMSRGNSVNALLKCRADWPPRRVDWILTRGLRVIDSGCLDEGTSDHPLMWAELELPDEPSAGKATRTMRASGSLSTLSPGFAGSRKR